MPKSAAQVRNFTVALLSSILLNDNYTCVTNVLNHSPFIPVHIQLNVMPRSVYHLMRKQLLPKLVEINILKEECFRCPKQQKTAQIDQNEKYKILGSLLAVGSPSGLHDFVYCALRAIKPCNCATRVPYSIFWAPRDLILYTRRDWFILDSIQQPRTSFCQ